MNRFCAASVLIFVSASISATPPEPVPISRSAAPHGMVNDRYLDDVEGLARLAWQATRSPDPMMRLAAVEQMVRVSAHPRRVDTILATIEGKEQHPAVQQAARRVRIQLRQETANMKWVETESEIGQGRSVVAHDPIPYREALASLLTAPEMTNVAPCTTCGPTVNEQPPTPDWKMLSAQQRWAASIAASQKANAQNLPKR
jgi:hypothetical protein